MEYDSIFSNSTYAFYVVYTTLNDISVSRIQQSEVT